MTPSEERLAFFYAIGEALNHWAHVEGQIERVVLGCVSASDRIAMAIGLSAVENFRSRLALCDNLVEHKHGDSVHFVRWQQAFERIKNLSGKRNKLVHHKHRVYINNPAGRRYALVESTFNGKLQNLDGSKPPHGSLFVRDIVAMRQDFFALTWELSGVYELFRGHPAPFPELAEPVDHLPTIRSIRNQIRAELGLPPKPSRK